MKKSRAERAIKWIEKFCRSPGGDDQGKPVRLTDAEREQIHALYATPEGPQGIAVAGRLAAFLVLLHIAGIEAVAQKGYRGPVVEVDTRGRSGARHRPNSR